jgi:hypothetical protein
MGELEEGAGLGFPGRQLGSMNVISVFWGLVEITESLSLRKAPCLWPAPNLFDWQFQEQWEVKSLEAGPVPWDPEAPGIAGQWLSAKRKGPREPGVTS